MKKTIVLFIAIAISTKLIAQQTPLLSENDLVHHEDLKKKAGWMKVKLDADFKDAANGESAIYEYYDFVNIQGYFTSTFTSKNLFTRNKYKIIYTKSDPALKSNLLNGTLDFFDKHNQRIYRYVFKDGFYVKLFDFHWGLFQRRYNGKMSGVIEYQPEKNALECWGNYYDYHGILRWDLHERYDGSRYKDMVTLPVRPTTISVEELNIGKVWQQAEFDAYKYQMYIDTLSHEGKKAATIKSNFTKIKGSGALLQTCKADNFQGKRIRMSGYMKSENVKEWAGFWLSVNQAGSENYLFHDNMKDRPIQGTTAWTKYEIVFDVPSYATTIRFGAIIHGTGQIWFDDLKFEVVDDSINTTGWSNPGSRIEILSEPSNLDFEKLY